MRATVALALQHGVAIGAHPGFADRKNFGRQEQSLPVAALRELVVSQIAALARFAELRHVKPHGALYNQAARDPAVARAVVAAVREIDPALVLFALAGSELARAGRAAGLAVAEEVFADRSYQRDGSLTPRSGAGALITDESVAVAQVLRMAREGVVRATDGTDVAIRADTVCLHGDGAHAVAFARRLNAELRSAGMKLGPYEPRMDANSRE